MATCQDRITDVTTVQAFIVHFKPMFICETLTKNLELAPRGYLIMPEKGKEGFSRYRWKSVAVPKIDNVKLPTDRQVLHTHVDNIFPAHLLDRWSYHEETSMRLFSQDRSAVYGGFHLYTLKGAR